MNASSNSGQASTRNQVWTAAGVALCLAVGGAFTWWISSAAETPTEPAPPVQGRSFRAPLPKPVEKTSDPTPAPRPPPKIDDEFATVTFDTLSSFFYMIPDADDLQGAGSSGRGDQIPAPIRELDGKKVAIQGYMMPLKNEKGGCREFLLVRDQGICCYRRTPRMNEWIAVKMNGDKLARLVTDKPVTVFGILGVGEKVENGTVMNVYRLAAEDIAGPLDL